MKRIIILSIAIIIILSAFLVYLPSFSAPFQFDDVKRILGQKAVENLDIASTFHYSKTRFLLYLTLGVNYYFGKYNVFGYHLVNFIIHILASLLVFALSLFIFNSPRLKNSFLTCPTSEVAFGDFRSRILLSFFSAMIFALHPLQTESVTYIWQRGESMAGMFYFLSIFLYARFRLNQADGRGKKYGLLTYAGCIMSIILCSLTKPTSATLPLAILLYEMCFLSRDIKEFKTSLKYLVPILLFILLPLALSMFDINENEGVGIRFSAYYMPYYYSKLRVLVNSLFMMLVPVNQSLEHSYIWSVSLINPVSTLGSLVVLLILIVVCVISFKRSPLISFAIIWFYLTLAVTSILYLEYLFFEHYLYLTLFGFGLIVPVLCLNIAAKAKIDRRYWIACLVILTAVYSFGAYSRNLVWKTEISLWEDAVKKNPYGANGHYTLGVYYFRAKRYREALKEYLTALKIKPGYPEAYYRLGEYYSASGDIEASISNYKRAIEINPEFLEAYINLGYVYSGSKRFKNARECFINALKYTSNRELIKNINAILKEMSRYE